MTPLRFRERISGRLFRVAMRLPRSMQKLLAGGTISVDGAALEPEAQLALRLMALQPEPPVGSLSVAEERRQTARLSASVAGPPTPMARVRDLMIQGAVYALPARLYAPEGAAATSPLVIYYHGGGWVLCDLNTHDGVCRLLAQQASVRVLSVNYRLAPEHRHPAAVDDAYATFLSVVTDAVNLGADPARIAVAGDSAGGHLAAVVCQDAVAAGGPVPAYQVLLYPATDLSSRSPSYDLFRDGFFLTAEKMEWFIDHYLRRPEDAFDPRASPLRAKDLSGLPPAYVATAGFDVLRDEGEAYARRMADAGVEVSLRRFRGLVHGFANTATIGRAARAAMVEVSQAIATALGTR